MDWLFREHLKHANSLCALSAQPSTTPRVSGTDESGRRLLDAQQGTCGSAKRRVTLSNVALDGRDRVGDAREGCSREELAADTADGDDEVASELRRPDEFYSELARFRFSHRRDCFSGSDRSLASSSSASAAALVSALMLESSANLRRYHWQRSRELSTRPLASDQLRMSFPLITPTLHL